MCANITPQNDRREAKVLKMCKHLDCVVYTKFFCGGMLGQKRFIILRVCRRFTSAAPERYMSCSSDMGNEAYTGTAQVCVLIVCCLCGRFTVTS